MALPVDAHYGLLRRQPANPLPGLLPRQHARVAELSPLGDLRGIDPLLPQIGTTSTGLDGGCADPENFERDIYSVS